MANILVNLDRIAGLNSPEQNPASWIKRWGGVLDRIRREGVSLETLETGYFGCTTLRLDQNFVYTSETAFKANLHQAILRTLFQNYLSESVGIVELGCGSGFNLALCAGMFPTIQLWGCDWAPVSQHILTEISNQIAPNLKGLYFDLLTLEGQTELPIMPETTVWTVHALEQIGNSFEPLLDYLLARKPKLVIHLEPTLELYDENSVFDQLAIRYHRHLGYLENYLPTLHRLEVRGDIKIIEERRLHFGCPWHEAYSVVVWRPN